MKVSSKGSLEVFSEVSIEAYMEGAGAWRGGQVSLEGGLALGGKRDTSREMFAEVVRCPQVPSEVSSEGKGGQWCPELSSEVSLDGS